MEEIINYYVNLLILQYRNKPKAKATIESLAKILFEDVNGEVFLLKFQDAYDLDTASLAQLNTLAQYVGFSDKLNIVKNDYFKLSDYNGTDETPGLSSYDGANVGYPLLSYAGYTYIEQSVTNVAGISFFRNVLKFLTEMKNEPLSLESLDRLLYKYFGEDLYVKDGVKQITYVYGQAILKAFQQNVQLVEEFIKKYMPRPMGCGIGIEKKVGRSTMQYDASKTLSPDSLVTVSLEDNITVYKLAPNQETTLVFDTSILNIPAGATSTFYLLLDMSGGTQTINFPAGVQWGNTSPTMTADVKYLLSFMTPDDGVTWIGNQMFSYE